MLPKSALFARAALRKRFNMWLACIFVIVGTVLPVAGHAQGNSPQVPQGGSNTFPSTGSQWSAGGALWDIVAPSGTVIANSFNPSSWGSSYAPSSGITVSAPLSATIGSGYLVRQTYYPEPQTTRFSANFSVVAQGMPSPPTGLMATANNSGQVQLQWTGPASASYTVLRGTQTGGPYPQTWQTSAPSYTDASVTAGSTYFYVVTITVNGLTSGYSNQATATLAPAAPVMTSAVPGATSITVNWPQDPGATAYYLYWTTIPSDPYMNLIQLPQGAVSYNHTGLTVGVQYYYCMSATNAGGTSGLSNTVSAIPGPPPAPTLWGTAGNASVTLYWTDPVPSSFTLYWGYVWNQLTNQIQLPAGTTTYPMTGLTNGVPYGFFITATDNGGTSPSSEVVWLTPSAGPPAPVITSAVPGNSSVTVNWTGSSGSTYTFYWSTSPTEPFSNSTQLAAGTTSYTQTGLTNGTQYYFYLTASNSTGTSAPSNEVSAIPGPPPAPVLSATAGNSSVALSWTESITSSYTIYWSTQPTGTFNQIQVSQQSQGGTYTQTGLTNGTTYYYYVTATDSGGTSAPSNEVSATPSATLPPAAPVIVSAVAGNTTVTLN